MEKTLTKRYYALDILRGMTIALMIMVNNPGSWSSIYPPLKHAAWHGFTPTDWVFPSFLFVVGTAMSFSMRKYEQLGNAAILRKIFKRAGAIFLIGLLLNAFPFIYRTDGGIAFKNLANIRIMGVLQRIALCYLFGALIIHYLKLKKSVIVGVVILFVYWAIMYFFGSSPLPYSLENNAALKFDNLIFRPENIYKGFGIVFDPEGLLSTLTATVNVIAGYAAGVFIQKSGKQLKTVLKLIGAGVLLLAVALLWDPFFPINKPIWTSSYVLYSVGWTLIVLAILIYVLELWNLKKWAYFFEAFGKNPLFIYVLSGVVAKLLGFIQINGTSLHSWIYKNLYLSWLDNINASLAFAISFIIVMWLIGYVLDKKRIYIKV
ncbi:acyltransferase family protein [Arenibacter amylolyticus]|uniref:acyltransferase family protein n=1 Tax=Arenibacter amylolyticus TaxID=1406873 RepID=UPI000A394AB1|nr:heparan-alpha-glucosaminide N-acetyltransferase domain-containing protein [Arenibacter amylolyticus]